MGTDRRVLRGLLWLVLAAWVGVAAAQTSTLPGDLDRDGRLSAADAIRVLRLSLRLEIPTPQDIALGDVAPVPGTQGRPFGDGRLTVVDAVRILRRVAGLEPGPWPGGEAIPVLPRLVRVNTQAPLTQPIALKRGFTLSGKVLDTAGKPVAGLLAVTDAFQGVVGNTPIQADGSYRILVSPGTYNLWVTSFPLADQQTQVLTRNPVGSATVTGDTVRNVTRPNLPPLFTVNVTLTQQDTRYQVQEVDLIDATTINEQAVPSTGTRVTVANNRFTAVIPAGIYQARFTAAAPSVGGGTFTFVAPWSLNVGSSFNATRTLPSLSHLTGTVTGPDGQPVASGSVLAKSRFAFVIDIHAEGTIKDGEASVWMGPGTYAVAYAPAALQQGSQSFIGFQLNDIAPVGETVRNVTLSPFPQRTAEVAGTLQDPQGRPLGGVQVMVDSTSLANVSPAYFFSGETTSGPDGRFSLAVPPGSYILTIIPPGDTPTVSPPPLL